MFGGSDDENIATEGFWRGGEGSDPDDGEICFEVRGLHESRMEYFDFFVESGVHHCLNLTLSILNGNS